jgi:signal transduction histidine kinase
MSLQIALLLSVVIQFATAIIALSLVRKTKKNIAWWLISIGFLLMAIRRLFELFQAFDNENNLINDLTNSWLGVITSVIMLVSLSFIKHIFNLQARLDQLKKENEAKVFSAILETEENQKQKFSKELHDGLGPILSAVKMSVSALSKNDDSQQNLKIISNTENLIDEALLTVKEISNNLSPHILNNFGLIKAIKSFINKLPEEHKTKIQLSSNIHEERFEFAYETVIYRGTCELINNTIKHGKAKNIYLDIIKDKQTVNLKYLDDGIGFDYSEEKDNNIGMGLTNIISRIKSVKGSSFFYSKPGEGFNANFVISLDRK